VPNRAAAEEIHRAALAHQLDRLLPRIGHSDSFNRDIDAAVLRRQRARLADGLANVGRLHHMRRAQLPRRFHLAVVLHNGNHFAAGQRGHMQNHQPQRAAADHRHRISGARARILKSMHRAGQRLGQRSVLQRHVVGNMERVLFHNPRRNADELGVGAVVEQQVVAEVFLAALTKKHCPQGAEFSATTRSPGKAGDALARLNNRPASSCPNSAGGTIMRAW
jgi:hypothetical protein